MFEYEVMREVLFIIVIDPYQKVTIPFNALQVLNRSCFDYLSQDRVGPITLFHKQRLFRLWSATYDKLMDMSEYYTPEIKEDQKHCFTNVFDLEELFPERFKKPSSLPVGKELTSSWPDGCGHPSGFVWTHRQLRIAVEEHEAYNQEKERKVTFPVMFNLNKIKNAPRFQPWSVS